MKWILILLLASPLFGETDEEHAQDCWAKLYTTLQIHPGEESPMPDGCSRLAMPPDFRAVAIDKTHMEFWKNDTKLGSVAIESPAPTKSTVPEMNMTVIDKRPKVISAPKRGTLPPTIEYEVGGAHFIERAPDGHVK